MAGYSSYTNTWDETVPAATSDRNLGDDAIRDFKLDVRERLFLGPYGQCRLTRHDATTLKLIPLNGNKILLKSGAGIDTWAPCGIPSAGVTVDTTGLAASTFYYIYAYLNSGVITLAASTTAYTPDSDTGVMIKTGDALYSLVGIAKTNASTQFVNSGTDRLVRSWFNPVRYVAAESTSTAAIVTAAVWTVVVTVNILSFGSYSNLDFMAYVSGFWSTNTTAYAILDIDGTLTGASTEKSPQAVTTTTAHTSFALVEPYLGLAAGSHAITLSARSYSGSTTIERISLTVTG